MTDDHPLSPSQLVSLLNEMFGTTLVAVMAGSRDSTAPTRWARPGANLRPEHEVRLRFAHHIHNLIAASQGPDVTRMWFVGANPVLSGTSPALAIRAGHLLDVAAAADHLLSGGFSA